MSLRRAIRSRLRKLHDDLMYELWCKPGKGIVGSCENEDHPTYARYGLGQYPRCRWCHRETRRT